MTFLLLLNWNRRVQRQLVVGRRIRGSVSVNSFVWLPRVSNFLRGRVSRPPRESPRDWSSLIGEPGWPAYWPPGGGTCIPRMPCFSPGPRGVFLRSCLLCGLDWVGNLFLVSIVNDRLTRRCGAIGKSAVKGLRIDPCSVYTASDVHRLVWSHQIVTPLSPYIDVRGLSLTFSQLYCTAESDRSLKVNKWSKNFDKRPHRWSGKH